MKTFLAILALVASTTLAYAGNTTCGTMREVKVAFPSESPKYTHYMKDHRGSKCWYAPSVGFEHDRSLSVAVAKASRKEVKVAQTVPPPPVTAPTTIPVKVIAVRSLYPREEESLSVAIPPTPSELINQAFLGVRGLR